MSLELEHFMGVNAIPHGALFHPNGQKYVFSAGASVVIADLLDPHQQQFLRFHDDTVNCLVLSSSGRYLASGQLGEHSDVYVYDTTEQRLLFRFEEHDRGIQALAFSQDEKILVSIGLPEDNNMIFWDMSNGCIIASTTKIPMHTKCAVFMGFVKDIKRRDTSFYQLCTAGADGIQLWSLDPFTGDLESQRVTGDARATITRQIHALHYTPDYEFVYAATSSGDYVVCNVKSQRIISSITATKMALLCILVHAGKVYIGCGDKSVKIYSLHSDFLGQIAMDGAVIGLSLSSDQLEMLALTASGSICRVNLSSGQSLVLSEAHTQSVVKVVFDQGNHPDRIASISADHSIKVWDLSDYAVVCTAVGRREQEPGAQPWSLAFNNLLFSGWSDGKVLAHSAETGESLWMLDNAHHGGVSALILSHNKRFMLTGAPSGDIRLWELRTRELISHLKEHKQRVNALVLRQDDTVAMSGSRDRCTLTWDLRSEKRVMCHMQRMGGINDIVLSRDESFLISVGQDKRIVIWHALQADALFSCALDGENDEGFAIAISQCGQFVVTGGSAGILRLWRLSLDPQRPSLQMLNATVAHSKPILSVAFGPSDKQVASCGEDGCIFLWWMYK